MFLAEMDGGTGAAIGVVLTALAGAVVMVLAKARENRAADRKDAIAGLQDLIRQLEAQNERRDAVITQHGEAIDAVRRSEAACRESLAEAKACIHFLYDIVGRQHAQLRKLGADPGDMPELPEIRDRPDAGAAFAVRQARQSAELLREADRSLPPKGGAQ